MQADQSRNEADAVQTMVARMIALSPVGQNLLLIGGFRYRLIDHSSRISRDVDYHWTGDLVRKQEEMLSLLQKRVLPALKREFGYEGRVDPASGPEADSPSVRSIVLSVWRQDQPGGRLEIPVEITKVSCADGPDIRTVDGVIYPTVSDADQIENKVISVFNRLHLQHRDLVDIFLFSSKLLPDSPARLKEKLRALGVGPDVIDRKMKDFSEHSAYHAKAIQAVIDSQLDPVAAANIAAAGGGGMILERVVQILQTMVCSKS